MEKYFKAISDIEFNQNDGSDTFEFGMNVSTSNDYNNKIFGGEPPDTTDSADPVLRTHKKRPGQLIPLDSGYQKINLNAVDYSKYFITSARIPKPTKPIDAYLNQIQSIEDSPIYAETTPYHRIFISNSSSPLSTLPRMKQIPDSPNATTPASTSDMHYTPLPFSINYYMGVCYFNKEGHEYHLEYPNYESIIDVSRQRNSSLQQTYSHQHLKDEYKEESKVKEYTLVTTFMEYGVQRLISFLRQRRIGIMDVNKLYHDSVSEFFVSLPNEFTNLIDHRDMIQSIFHRKLIKYYEPPMVMICKYDFNLFETDVVDTLVWLCDKNLGRFNWYQINYTFDALLKDLSIFNSLFETQNPLKRMILEYTLTYFTWDTPSDLATRVTRKEMRKRLNNYKRWFVSSEDMENYISLFWLNAQLDESITPEIYFRCRFSESSVTFLNFDVDDLDRASDIYVKIKIT